jgi:hypothetical protein
VTQLVKFELDGGGSVLVEVDEEPGVKLAAPHEKIIEVAQLSFANALTGVRNAASTALDQFRGMAHKPDEIEIKFSLQLDAEAGAIIARTGVSGNIEVTVKWGHLPAGEDGADSG